MNSRTSSLLGLTFGALLVLTACSSGSDQASTESSPLASASATASASGESGTPSSNAGSPSPSATTVAAGSEISYAEYEKDPEKYEGTDVVLFFSAPWCSTCQAVHESLDEDGIPDGMTIVDVDFDTAQDLRQKYGVTVQHTFVQIDTDGKELTKFSGAPSGQAIQEELV